MSNGTTTKNGIRLPVWAVSILVVLIIQLVAGVVSFATLKAEFRSFKTNMESDMSEVKFRVGNIDEGVRILQKDTTRFETKCEDYERRFGRLENYHGILAP